jgi:hypothetical protein
MKNTSSYNIDDIKLEFEHFINTDEGKGWISEWKARGGDGDLGDYLYDYYPEMLL